MGRIQHGLGKTNEDSRRLIGESNKIMEVAKRTNPGHITVIVKFIAAGVCLALFLIACQEPGQKSGIAADTTTNMNQDVREISKESRPAWQEAWLKFKRENDSDIAENERRIVALRRDVGKANLRFRAIYHTRIDQLERRNYELRDRTDNYRDEGNAKWAAFKLGIKRDMDGLKLLLKKTIIKEGLSRTTLHVPHLHIR